MDTLAQILISLAAVAASVVLSLIGYRQIIGAYRERVRSANSAIESILLRRIVQESYTPSPEDISRFAEGKARDHGVKRRDLWSEIQILNTIVTRITESDFLTPDQRKEILHRLSSVRVTAEEEQFEELAVMEGARPKTAARWITMVVMAGLASVCGAALTFYSTREILSMEAVVVFTVSLALISGLFIIFRIRERQEEPSGEGALRTAIDFEREVAKLIEAVGGKLVPSSEDKRFDFFAEIKGKRILIEAKAWTNPVSVHIVRDLAEGLRRAVQELGADQAIVVTKASVGVPKSALRDYGVRVMSLRETRDYFVHGRG